MPNLAAKIAAAREVLAKATPGTLDTDPHRPRTGFELRAAGVHIADVMEVNSRLTRTVASANKERLVIGWNALPALLDAVEEAAKWHDAENLFRTAFDSDDHSTIMALIDKADETKTAFDSALARLAEVMP